MPFSAKIPQDQILVFLKIVTLGDREFASLLSAFGLAAPALPQKRFAANIADKAEGIKKSEAMLILRTVFSLYQLKDSEDMSSSDMAEAISQAAAVQLAQQPEFTKDKIELLKRRIEQLLGFDAVVALASRAADVLTEHDQIFCKSRILSDIRPVFTKIDESPSAAVIVHNLQIGFHKNGKHQEWYVALDNADLEQLKTVILRAEQKTKGLIAILKQSNTPLLDVQ